MRRMVLPHGIGYPETFQMESWSTPFHVCYEWGGLSSQEHLLGLHMDTGTQELELAFAGALRGSWIGSGETRTRTVLQ